MFGLNFYIFKQLVSYSWEWPKPFVAWIFTKIEPILLMNKFFILIENFICELLTDFFNACID